MSLEVDKVGEDLVEGLLLGFEVMVFVTEDVTVLKVVV